MEMYSVKNVRPDIYVNFLKQAIEQLQKVRDDYYTTDWPEDSADEKIAFEQMGTLFTEITLLTSIIALYNKKNANQKGTDQE